jgi:hypothetical protein
MSKLYMSDHNTVLWSDIHCFAIKYKNYSIPHFISPMHSIYITQQLQSITSIVLYLKLKEMDRLTSDSKVPLHLFVISLFVTCDQ